MQYFDNEKAWKRAFGLRFFSEGITDIKLLCEDQSVSVKPATESPDPEETTVTDEEPAPTTAKSKSRVKRQENAEGKTTAKEREDVTEKPDEETDEPPPKKENQGPDEIGGFTDSKRDKYKKYVDLYVSVKFYLPLENQRALITAFSEGRHVLDLD